MKLGVCHLTETRLWQEVARKGLRFVVPVVSNLTMAAEKVILPVNVRHLVAFIGPLQAEDESVKLMCKLHFSLASFYAYTRR